MTKKIYEAVILFFIVLQVLVSASLHAGLKEGKKLPEFKLPSVNGKQTALTDYLGKVVIIHLWKCQ
jgi:hypothetical protein